MSIFFENADDMSGGEYVPGSVIPDPGKAAVYDENGRLRANDPDPAQPESVVNYRELMRVAESMRSGGAVSGEYASIDKIAPEKAFVGDFIKTAGYYERGDGGGAVYEILGERANDWDIKLAEGKYASIRNMDFVSYRMFGAVLDGVSDDEIPLQNAHAYANANGVKVKNHGGIIYKESDAQIPVFYDVDLSGSTILVKNENTTFRAWYRIGDTTGRYYSMEFTPEQKAELREGTSHFTMLNNSIPSNVAIKLKENNYTARDDAGYVYMTDRAELMVHDMYGICSGPLIEDWTSAGGGRITVSGVEYTSVFTASYTRIPATTLVFTGCDVDISTTDNVPTNVVNITRHNVVIRNFTIRPYRNSLRNLITFKNSVFYAEDCYNLTFENILGFNIAGRNNGDVAATSGYIIRLSNCMKVTVRNCRLNGYWGSTAAENVKDVHYENTEANRVDIHNYFRDLFISGCTIYNRGVQVGYGKGILSIRDCAFYYSRIPDYSHPNNLLQLNSTYGRLFSGLISVENVAMDVWQSGQFAQLLYTILTPAAKTISKAPYKLPEIRMRNIVLRLYEPDYSLRLMYFAGSLDSNTTMANMTLAAFENISTNMPAIALYADETENVRAAGESSIYVNNVTGLDATIPVWMGSPDNVKPVVREGGSGGSGPGTLTIDSIQGLRAALDGKITAADLQNGLSSKVNNLARVLTATDNLDDIRLGGYYSAPWNVGNNPDNSQGFMQVMPSNSAYSTCVQIFVAAASGNMKIRNSFWDADSVLQWTPWKSVTLT